MNVGQDLFRAALLDGARPVPEGLCDGLGRAAGRRFNVYRNNVAVALTEALSTGFPVIAKLLGKANMDGLAGLFLRRHPPASPVMMLYGDGFPAFLASQPQLDRFGYLPDVARLELALRQSYHAADTDPFDPQALAALSPDDLIACQLILAPSVRLIRSDWPIHDIWRMNTEDGAPKPRAQAQDVVITRPEFDPVPHLLPPEAPRSSRHFRTGAPSVRPMTRRRTPLWRARPNLTLASFLPCCCKAMPSTN